MEQTQKVRWKLNVYENGYYLSAFDPNDQSQSAKYYNDMNGLIDAQKRGAGPGDVSIAGGDRLNNDNSNSNAQNDQFFFNKAEIVIYKRKYNTVTTQMDYLDEAGNVTTDPTKYVVQERLAPGIYLNLNRHFFKKKVLDAAAADLYNHNTFRQYFKGLYFQMEQIAGQEGAMAMLNFNNAKLNINYNSISEGQTAVTSKTLLLSLGTGVGSATVSLQNYSYGGSYSAGLANTANVFGNPNYGQNERLYLKGGKGSVVYLDIFGDDRENGSDGDTDNDDGIEDNTADESYNNGIPDELDLLRRKGWLINDAYLEFYVDNSSSVMGATNQEEAERIYLFDATNQKVLYDCAFDNSTSSFAKNNKYVYGGILTRDKDVSSPTYKKGIKYKIRITQHINNILNSSNVNINKNVKLGLCVTESVLVTSNFYFKNPLTFGPGSDDDIEYFPVASIMAQQGTVLHGTHSADASKKLKLVIHYTKPN